MFAVTDAMTTKFSRPPAIAPPSCENVEKSGSFTQMTRPRQRLPLPMFPLRVSSKIKRLAYQ